VRREVDGLASRLDSTASMKKFIVYVVVKLDRKPNNNPKLRETALKLSP
jgi:hypothetical protein